MQHVWLVYVDDCEGSSVECICSTRERAVVEWDKIRLELLAEYSERARNLPSLYNKMIENLSCTDPETINNYPHGTPKIQIMELL